MEIEFFKINFTKNFIKYSLTNILMKWNIFLLIMEQIFIFKKKKNSEELISNFKHRE